MNLNVRERLSKLDWKTISIVFLIFLLAFGIRAYLLRYGLMFEFDTYWHARMTGEIIQHGVPPAVEPLAYYQLGDAALVPLRTQGFWYISAFFYFIAAFFTTGTLAYSKPLLIEVVKFLPALYGALVCLGLYFVGKEAYGKNAGYLMAFFGAVSASFIYRSMAGFFEAGTLGYVFMIFGFYFVLRAVKRMDNTRKWTLNGAIAAVLLGLIAVIYALFIIVPVVLIFYLVFTAFDFVSRGQTEKAVSFIKVVGAILAGFVVVTMLLPNDNWISDLLDQLRVGFGKVGFLLPVAVLLGIGIVGAVVFFLATRRAGAQKGQESAGNRNWWAIAKMAFLYLILLGALVWMLSPKPAADLISSSVGEESPGNLYFFHKFGILMLLPIAALVLIPVIGFKRKETDRSSMLFFVFILLALLMAWDRLHYTYNFGVPLAIGAGYTVWYAIRFFQSRPKSERMIAGAAIAFLVLAGTASATLFTMNNTPTIELDTGWKEGLYWLNQNSSPDAKLFNWWDEGHWITFLAERRVITDNRNSSREANSDVGKFVLTEDLNEATGILKKYGSDYIVLGADLFSKRNSMVIYAFYSDKPMTAPDSRMDSVSSFELPCSKSDSGGTVSYQCGSAVISAEQLNTVPTVWTSQPSTIENGRDPVFYYRTTDNARFYKLSLKENQTIFAKIWFKAPETTAYVEEVFPANLPGYQNKELKIFKVNKEKLPSR